MLSNRARRRLERDLADARRILSEYDLVFGEARAQGKSLGEEACQWKIEAGLRYQQAERALMRATEKERARE